MRRGGAPGPRRRFIADLADPRAGRATTPMSASAASSSPAASASASPSPASSSRTRRSSSSTRRRRALDSEVEAAIQESFYRLMEGKTVIAIAHRLSTIAAMDRLVVLDHGRIVETGSHDELLARRRALRRLWRRQSGGFLDASASGTARRRE